MSNPTLASRLLLVAAGLCGALGVAAAARASHAGDDNLGIAANFLLLHAPVLIGLSLMATRMAIAAGGVLLVGLLLFAGDLAARSLLGGALFPLAAPLGGGGLIVGWLLVVLAGVVGWRRAD
ncbi:DUF423 domain-containing protein [Devosia sp. A16]|uniref:DUF423 domain-containing protein n=1 Tax=Devosia sp. A16 TaxID=1736675 RepID=UPI0006D782D9|nr:DUF423 domain-containing protein [Devosia sp. A16]